MGNLSLKNWIKYFAPIALIVFLSSTNPNDLPLALFLVPVLLLLLSVYFLAGWLLSKTRTAKTSLTNRTIAGLISFIVTIAIIMQSMSQLTSGDAVLFLLIASVMAAYLYKASS